MKKFFTLIAMMFVTGAAMYAQDWGDNEFANSDLEAEAEYPWFHVKSNLDNPDGAITTAIPEAGIGVNGSKGIKVVAKAGASADWDSQFWIQIPTDIADGVLEYGEQVLISFDCRAEWEIPEGDEEVESITIGTQGHNAPGSYRNNTGVGNVEFKSEWSHHEGALAPDANPYSIAFNLCQNHHAYDATFYFDNITIQRVKKNEEIIQYWAKLVTNGDFESDNTDSYVVRIYQQGDKAPEIFEGEGVDDSRAIKVVIPAKQETDWDSQFFIKLKEVLPQGQAFKISMDIKASEKPANQPQTQCHAANPGDYIYWACIGDMTFDTEWTTFEKTVTVSSDMAGSNNNFQTIAFNMARNDHEITYWFDNINVRILKEGSQGDIPEIIELQETIDAAEAVYSNDDVANADIRQAFVDAYENAQSIVSALDQDNAEAAMYTLVNAKGKLEASINDYKKLDSFIGWVEGKMEVARSMGANYEDLFGQLDEIAGNLRDQYNEKAWTRAEVNENTNQSTVKSVIAQYIGANAQDGDDITIMLENPSFAGNTSGWQRDGGSKFLDYGPSNRNTLDLGNNGGFLPTGMAEVWHGSYNAYQVMENLPAGLYTLTVNACQRGDEGSNESAVLYASVNGQETTQLIMSVYADPAPEMLFDTDGIMQNGETNSGTWPSIENPNGEGWIPNGKGSANYHLNAGFYLNTVNVLLEEGGTLRMGVKDSNTTGWVVLDNFKVVYHSLDNVLAYRAAVENQINRLNSLKGEGTDNMTYPAADALENGIAAGEKLLAGDNTIDDCKAMLEQLGNAFNDAVANTNTLKKLDAARDAFDDSYYTYVDGEATCMPTTAVEATKANDILMDEVYMNYTTDELNAFIENMVYLTSAMKIPAEAADATASNGVLLELFVDPDFEDYAAVGANHDYPGWSGSGFGTGGGTAGPVGERWNQSNGFNTYVDFQGLPAGNYELSCDGAYRTSISNDWNITHAGATTDNEAFLYANTAMGEFSTALFNITSVALTEADAEAAGLPTSADVSRHNVTVDEVTTTYIFPDQLYTADLWMQQGYYNNNTVKFQVGKDGKARVGVRRKGQSNDWCFVDNFKLTYFGGANEVDAIQSIEAPVVKGIYTISGVRVNNLNKAGLYIVNGKKVLVK